MKKVIKIVGLLLISGMFCVNGWSKPGEPDDPHKITNASVLAAIGTGIYGLGDSYILMNDIDLKDWIERHKGSWKPIGTDYDNEFTGTFDGGGFTISNLCVKNKKSKKYDFMGLFGKVEDATIKNLKVEKVEIEGAIGGPICGGLAGYVRGASKIENVHIIGIKIASTGGLPTGGLVGEILATNGLITNCSVSAFDDSYIKAGLSIEVGGLVGSCTDTDIINCFSEVNIKSGHRNSTLFEVGGLIGYYRSSSNGPNIITNVYATGDVAIIDGKRWACAGGLIGNLYNGGGDIRISNVYATGSVTNSAGTDGEAGGLIGGYSFFGGEGSLSLINAYATGKVKDGPKHVGGLVGYIGPYQTQTVIENSYWNTETTGQDTSVGGGEGKITTEMMRQATYEGWDFMNTWSINEEKAYPILIKKIETKTGLKAFIEGTGDFRRRWIDYRILKNINMSDVPIVKLAEEPFTGKLSAEGEAVISNLTLDFSDQENVGFFAQTDGATISNVRFKNLKVTGKTNVGGLVGYSIEDEKTPRTTITDCYVSGDKTEVNGNKRVGGLVGWSQCTTISYTDSSDKANDFMNGGTVTGTGEYPTRIGGLVGWNQDGSLIENATTEAEVTSAEGDKVGGLVGENEGGNVVSTIKSCRKSKGNVTGKKNVGGLVGRNYDATVEACYVENITVKATKEFLGGLVGKNEYWKSKGRGIISKSYAKDINVDGSGCKYVGGLVGVNYKSKIDNSYVLALDKDKHFVKGKDNVGGLVGRSGGDCYAFIYHSYAAIKVAGTTNVGGLVGLEWKTRFDNSYWDTQTTGQDRSAGQGSGHVKGKTTAEMKQKSTYEGWYFGTIWKIDEDVSYPTLKWQDETSASASYDGSSYGLGSEGMYL